MQWRARLLYNKICGPQVEELDPVVLRSRQLASKSHKLATNTSCPLYWHLVLIMQSILPSLLVFTICIRHLPWSQQGGPALVELPVSVLSSQWSSFSSAALGCFLCSFGPASVSINTISVVNRDSFTQTEIDNSLTMTVIPLMLVVGTDSSWYFCVQNLLMYVF